MGEGDSYRVVVVSVLAKTTPVVVVGLESAEVVVYMAVINKMSSLSQYTRWLPTFFKTDWKCVTQKAKLEEESCGSRVCVCVSVAGASCRCEQ